MAKGRPKKYATAAARKAAYRIMNREAGKRWRHRTRQARIHPGLSFIPGSLEIEAIRPPPEVLMEREFRVELLTSSTHSACARLMGDPPIEYSAAYPEHAYRQQRLFASA